MAPYNNPDLLHFTRHQGLLGILEKLPSGLLHVSVLPHVHLHPITSSSLGSCLFCACTASLTCSSQPVQLVSTSFSYDSAIVCIFPLCSLPQQWWTCTASKQHAVAGAVKDSLTKPDWAHVFLTVIQPLALHQPQQEGQTASALRAACAGLMSKHSSRLRRAGVVQWEVRLRMPQGLPAWRVVVSSPTGAFKPMKRKERKVNAFERS